MSSSRFRVRLGFRTSLTRSWTLVSHLCIALDYPSPAPLFPLLLRSVTLRANPGHSAFLTVNLLLHLPSRLKCVPPSAYYLYCLPVLFDLIASTLLYCCYTTTAMKDPFPIPPSRWLSAAVQPFADSIHFTTLPMHIHEVVGSFLAYTFINKVLAPVISKRLFPVNYAKLSRERKINWDVHVVSLCQSVAINILALWVMWTDEERKGMNWQQRVWGYTGGAGMIQGLATGYFLWDLMISLQNCRLFGPGMLAHATSALLVFSFGFVGFFQPQTEDALLTAALPAETVCQLLRLHVHPVRALDSLPELPLVLRQIGYDWIQGAAL